jgi:hypothetical protein
MVGEVTFAPGEASTVITVQVAADTQSEQEETFSIQLWNPANANIGIGSAAASVSKSSLLQEAGLTGAELTSFWSLSSQADPGAPETGWTKLSVIGDLGLGPDAVDQIWDEPSGSPKPYAPDDAGYYFQGGEITKQNGDRYENRPEGIALVSPDGSTLALSFRGGYFPDWYPTNGRLVESFKPILMATTEYVRTHPSITQVWVTGTSLGGMVTNDLYAHRTDPDYLGFANATYVAFASGDITKRDDDSSPGHILNIGYENDYLFKLSTVGFGGVPIWYIGAPTDRPEFAGTTDNMVWYDANYHEATTVSWDYRLTNFSTRHVPNANPLLLNKLSGFAGPFQAT